MNRLRISGLLALLLMVVIAVAGFESGWFNGPASPAPRTTTSTSIIATSTQHDVAVTTIGNQSFYSFDFCSVPAGVIPPGWASIKDKPGWTVQNCSLAYKGTSTGYVGAYYTGRVFSNFTYSLTGIGLGYCPSDPTGSPAGQLPPVLVMTFRQQTTSKLNEYFFHLDIGKAQIIKEVNGTPITIATTGALGPGPDPFNPWGHFSMSVRVTGDTITASWSGPLFNGDLTRGTISATDPTFRTGYIGVTTYNCNAAFTDLSVTTPVG